MTKVYKTSVFELEKYREMSGSTHLLSIQLVSDLIYIHKELNGWGKIISQSVDFVMIIKRTGIFILRCCSSENV